MKLKLRVTLAVVVLTFVGVGVFLANPTVSELLTAGNGGVNIPANIPNNFNGLEGGHDSGSGKTFGWIAGEGGPDHPRFYGEIETPSPGVPTDGYTWARDGNLVEAVDSSPSATRQWEVKTKWVVRAVLGTKNYWEPIPADGTGYEITLTFETEVSDATTTGDWPALTDYDPVTLELENENTWTSPSESSVAIDEAEVNLGTVKFRYAVDMAVAGEITRADMQLQCRSVVYGDPDPAIPHNAGTIKLVDLNTGQPIIQLYEFF